MELVKLDPNEIEIPEVRVTAQFDEDLLEQFRKSVKSVGQITPIVCYKVNERILLCDGLHRLQEAIAAGAKEIDAVLIPGDELDVITKNLFLDHTRGRTPPSQMVQVIGILNEKYGLDSDQIREKTGLTRDYIERLMKIYEASPEVKEALDVGAIGVGVAFELSRLPYPAQQEEVLARSTIYRLTTKDVKELVDATLTQMEIMSQETPPPPSTEPPPPRVFGCEGCKKEVEPRFLRPVMLCPECFGSVWRLAKAATSSKDKDGEGEEGA